MPQLTYGNYPRLSPEGARRIRGIQGQLWGETSISSERMEYHAFPKMLGLAERAWAQQPAWARIENQVDRFGAMHEAWAKFAYRIGHFILPALDNLEGGINYRIPPPGALIEEGFLHANVRYPGLTIRYTLDGTEPTRDSFLFSGPIEVNGETVKLKSFTSTNRFSRTIRVDT